MAENADSTPVFGNKGKLLGVVSFLDGKEPSKPSKVPVVLVKDGDGLKVIPGQSGERRMRLTEILEEIQKQGDRRVQGDNPTVHKAIIASGVAPVQRNEEERGRS